MPPPGRLPKLMVYHAFDYGDEDACVNCLQRIAAVSDAPCRSVHHGAPFPSTHSGHRRAQRMDWHLCCTLLSSQEALSACCQADCNPPPPPPPPNRRGAAPTADDQKHPASAFSPRLPVIMQGVCKTGSALLCHHVLLLPASAQPSSKSAT